MFNTWFTDNTLSRHTSTCYIHSRTHNTQGSGDRKVYKLHVVRKRCWCWFVFTESCIRQVFYSKYRVTWQWDNVIRKTFENTVINRARITVCSVEWLTVWQKYNVLKSFKRQTTLHFFEKPQHCKPRSLHKYTLLKIIKIFLLTKMWTKQSKTLNGTVWFIVLHKKGITPN